MSTSKICRKTIDNEGKAKTTKNCKKTALVVRGKCAIRNRQMEKIWVFLIIDIFLISKYRFNVFEKNIDLSKIDIFFGLRSNRGGNEKGNLTFI